MPPDIGTKVLIHLKSGQTIETLVDGIEEASELTRMIAGAPRLVEIGDAVVVFNHAVAALELG